MHNIKSQINNLKIRQKMLREVLQEREQEIYVL